MCVCVFKLVRVSHKTSVCAILFFRKLGSQTNSSFVSLHDVAFCVKYDAHIKDSKKLNRHFVT